MAPEYGRSNWSAAGLGEERIKGDTWRVHFYGNAFTNRETGETYWLYRCAALALEQGFDGFSIVEAKLVMAHGSAVEGTITLLKGPFAPVPRKTFDARAIEASLRPYVTGPKCKDGNICIDDWTKSPAFGIFTKVTIANLTDERIGFTVYDDTYHAQPREGLVSMPYPGESEGWRLTISIKRCTHVYEMPRDLDEAPWRAKGREAIEMQLAQDMSIHVVPPRPYPVSTLPDGRRSITADWATLTTADWRSPIVPKTACD